jgi:FMN-dependent oxidoreductase (nitrilotriacetate monooxygenase family)
VSEPRRIHLFANYNPGLGLHPARWKVVDDPRQVLDLGTYVEIARIAEAATFDAVFLSDFPTFHYEPPRVPWHVLDPVAVSGAIASHTSAIGIVATLSTSFNEPYNVARAVASLDHMSDGRAAWNIVASYLNRAAANFGLDRVPPHAERYARAEEFVDVVLQLWDSWEPGAFAADVASGVYVDPAGLHVIDHRGEHFGVRGPLQVPRTPQGRPVLVQAGSSADGLAFAARHAEVTFILSATVQEARVAYARFKDAVQGAGRDASRTPVLAGVCPVVGSTEREALDHLAELDAAVDIEWELDRFAETLGIPLSARDLDRRVPPRPDADGNPEGLSEGISGNAWQFVQAHPELTLRETIHRAAITARRVVGAPEQIADDLEEWFSTGAADGFNVSSTHFPEGLERFAEHVVPELRRRGLFRTAYEGRTLRDHLGLDVPANRHVLTAVR